MAVLACLFLVQPLGTQRIGVLYAPILLLWFLLNCVVGIHNIAVWYPGVWKVRLSEYEETECISKLRLVEF